MNRKKKPKTTREHMALQIAALKERPHIVFPGIRILERARSRSSYERRRAFRSINMRGSGWNTAWDTRTFRLPELTGAVKRLGIKSRRLKLRLKLRIFK